MDEAHVYIAIDLKSFYASVECVERGLDPLTTNLVVADPERTEKTICLAVSPSLKAYGIPGRARLFEVVQKVKEVNAGHPKERLTYQIAPPRMALYMDYSTRIYNLYLRYVAPEDIHVYSIDEVFMDVTHYLGTYHMTARELAAKMIQDVFAETGITATAGIGTNLYLCKVALDIVAKHVKPDRNGVRIAKLDEMSYRRLLWNYRPLTDFWRVGRGYQKKLEENGLYTMGDIARCSLGGAREFHNEELLYRLFGINAELLIDHAWGWEPVTMEQIKAYRPQVNSISSGQVLHCPYDAKGARLVVQEMADALALDLVERRLVTDQLVLTVGYDIENITNPALYADYRGEIVADRYGRKIPKHAHGTVNLKTRTSSSRKIMEAVMGLYVLTIGTGYVCLLMGGLWMSRLLKHNLMEDVFNNENESFMQETRLIESEYSVNLPTRFYYRKRWNNGWINVVNPFRASIVLGTPGSGKSYAVVNNFIKQQIEKGFSQYIYDFKYPDLSTIAYNHLLNHPDGYKVKPKFYVINFDDPRRSHRCNPIHPDFMEDITDAYESAYTIMLNLNKTWVQKQGDFFVESPIILFASIIWYLKIYQNGKFCTFPHAIEFLNRRYEDIFPILTSYPELENYLSPFMDAWLGGAAEQLMGQIASAKIPLSRMISPQLYWVMSDSEFTLDINNPEEPKILCVGNNPDRQNIYGAALGLYNSRIVKLINKKGMLKSSVIIDELPTIYFKGLDNLIATARSNKVAVCLGFQDFSQLVRDYGDKEAKVVMNTVGNIFSGQVVGETAKTLSERFGKVLQKRQSISINRQDVSTSINTQMDALIPPSKISGLTQGMFVGSVSDNFNERIEQKIFHCEIVVDAEKVKREESAYKKIPVITNFTDEDGNDRMKETVQANYRRIKEEVKQIVQEELERIKNDPVLCKLLPDNETV